MVVDPIAVRTTVPLWVGGRTGRSLRRAVELGDAWAPFGLDTDQIATLVERARATDAWEQRSAPLDIALQPEALDPLGDPDATRASVARLRDAGATILNLRFVHHSADHYCEQLAAMQAVLD
jgi:alkanesulfonate monooxygenase SsuD/methylene tetrahydromethanopterin reductase-like flavin-dependent oxidoreductase (luciferase family)